MIKDKFNLTFWSRASNYATISCGIYAIFLRFFKKYIEDYIHPMFLFVFGITILSGLIFCGTMLFFLKRKIKRNG